MSVETGNPLDLRAWLSEARSLGELRDVSRAHWKLELGAISELNVKKAHPPALLFDRIPDYPAGYRVLTCSTASPARLSSILRIGVERDHNALVQKLRGRPAAWQARAAEFAPVSWARGPAQDNIAHGSDVDLFRFPSPLWHEGDGGSRRRVRIDGLGLRGCHAASLSCCANPPLGRIL